MIASDIRNWLNQVLKTLNFPEADFALEHPTELSHGDYAANIAMILSKTLGRNPREIADQILVELEKTKPDFISKIEVAGPGFINFYLTPEFFAESISEVVKTGDEFGKNKILSGKKIIVEHTQPNPFKEFHIGHLMNNSIGESLARILKANGAEVKTASYHGDVGLHVAKAIWAMKQSKKENFTLHDLGQYYAQGTTACQGSEEWRKEILAINKQIYDRTNQEINALYDLGRKVSLDYFKTLYSLLDSHFDFTFFESESGLIGKKLVEKNTKRFFWPWGIFVKSEGAVVFEGEKTDPKLHTRVFLNREGIPTYEAKELGLAQLKRSKFAYDESLSVTANEQNDFFRVVEVAIGKVFPELEGNLKHVSHGMLRLPSGKMSSRTGNVVTAENLIAQVGEHAKAKIAATDRDIIDVEKLVEQVSIAAIKFAVLKQASGKDIIFDFDKSISFEGDSGPYLQYTYVRTKSLVEKVETVGINWRDQAGARSETSKQSEESSTVEKLIYRLPEVIALAGKEFSPQYIVTYLLELASAYNSYYSANKIIDEADPATSAYRIALTAAVGQVIKNGLTVLGIPVPERM